MKRILFLLFAVWLAAGFAMPALAQPDLNDWDFVFDDPKTDPRIPRPFCLTAPGLEGTLSAKAIACMRILTYVAAVEVVGPIAKFMMPIALAVILLAVVLFGVRLTLGGVRAPKGEALIILFKAAFVVMMLGSLAAGTSNFNIGKMAIAIQDELMDWTAQSFAALTTDGTKTVIEECQRSQDPDPAVKHGALLTQDQVHLSVPVDGHPNIPVTVEVRLWNTLDCTVGLMLGMVRGVIFWTGIMSLLMAMVMSGPLGISIFMGAIMLFFTILLYITRCIFSIMHAYLAIAVILIFVPLVIPTIMFRRTLNYFTKWVFIYVGVIFQPFILIIFMAVSIFGISYFVVGDTNSPKSNLTRNNTAVYSMYEILGFKYLRNSDPKIQTEMRRLITRNMVNQTGATLFDFMDSSDMSNLAAQVLGKENARSAFKKVVSAGMSIQKMWNGITAGKNMEDILRMAQNVNVRFLNPINMPTIDLRPKGVYDKFIHKLQGRGLEEDEPTPEVDGLTPQLIAAFKKAGYGSATQDPKTLKWSYGGAHPLYISLPGFEGEVDKHFEEWFLLKLASAVFSAFIMAFLFLSLNNTVPDIARLLAGNGGIAIGSGMANMLSRSRPSGDSPLSNNSGVPMADRLESLLAGTEKRWRNSVDRAEMSFDPMVRGGQFFKSGGTAGLESATEAVVENTELGSILKRVQDASRGYK